MAAGRGNSGAVGFRFSNINAKQQRPRRSGAAGDETALVLKVRIGLIRDSLSVRFRTAAPGCPPNFVRCCARASSRIVLI